MADDPRVHRALARRAERDPGSLPPQEGGSVRAAASSSWTSSAGTCGRRRSSRATRSRTRPRPSSQPAAPPTACSTCSRSRASWGSPFTIDDFDAIARRTPVLADMKPWGRFHATDVDRAGGVALVARELAKRGLVHARRADGRRPHARPRSRPRSSSARARRSSDRSRTRSRRAARSRDPRGNLAPEGCVISSPARTARSHRGPARVFDAEQRASQRSRPARSCRATSSSSATRGRPARRACPRCSRSRPRSSARASATRSRWSPTGASRGRRTGSWSVTSRPRRARRPDRGAARKATSITIDVDGTRAAVELSDDEIASPASPPGRRRRRTTRPGVLREVRRPRLVGERRCGSARLTYEADRKARYRSMYSRRPSRTSAWSAVPSRVARLALAIEICPR